MGRYDSHKNPLSYRLNNWAGRRINNNQEQQAKSIPCHIQQIEKDFVHVAFETSNSIFTPPVMKMTQSFSRFGREPTQTKDMGVAVPGNYYLGGNTAFSGGRTYFYPRGNLSTLTFQPMSNLNDPKRDYDQHWETGGPNGWKSKVMEKQQEQPGGGEPSGSGPGGGNGGGGGGGATPAMMRVMQQRTPAALQRRMISTFATNGSGGSSSSSSNGQGGQQDQQQQNDLTEFSFDKNGKSAVQSKDQKHYLVIDQQNKSARVQSDGTTDIFGKDTMNVLASGGNIICNPDGKSKDSGVGGQQQ